MIVFEKYSRILLKIIYCLIMATLHLIHGFVGAGKTTFSRTLEAEISAIRFTFDIDNENKEIKQILICFNRFR